MQERWLLARSNRGALAALVLVVSAVLAACPKTLSVVATAASVPKDSPKPLSNEVVRAWQEAGAKVGLMGESKSGYLLFRSEPTGLAGVLPAFQFDALKEGVVSKLPDAGASFALDLSRTKVTDARVAELQKALPDCRVVVQ
ncbi:MAG: hypothetical protein VB835_11995 [Pirellulales bacterium]